MKMIYLHGFNSDENSKTAQKLRTSYPWLTGISYDYINPNIAHEQIKSFVEKSLKEDTNLIIIGTSLGGFWAYYFGQKYNVKSMLINPTINPSESLLKYLGENENFNTGAKKVLTEKDCAEYKKYEMEPVKGIFRSVVLGTHDLILDHKKTAKFFGDKARIYYVEEGHQISNVENLLMPLMNTVNYFPES